MTRSATLLCASSLATALMSAGACTAVLFPHHDAAPTIPTVDDRVVLNGHELVLHLSAGSRLAHGEEWRPLLVFATGDGGWRGKDLTCYRKLVSFGYDVVGFSAPEYIKHLRGEDETTTPLQLAADYREIIRVSKTAFHMAENVPVILVGVSRGAGLSVAAAGSRRLRNDLAGVVAVALTKEEEHVRFERVRRALRVDHQPPILQTYDYLPLLGSVPLSVVQSTHDNYLPADDARALFGPDTPRRQFHAVEARDHNFSDARDEMYGSVDDSLVWIEGLHADSGEGQPASHAP